MSPHAELCSDHVRKAHANAVLPVFEYYFARSWLAGELFNSSDFERHERGFFELGLRRRGFVGRLTSSKSLHIFRSMRGCV